MTDLAIAALHERDPERLSGLIHDELLQVLGGDLGVHKAGDWDETAGWLRVRAMGGTRLWEVDEESLRVIRRGYPFAGRYGASKDRTPAAARQIVGVRGWERSETARHTRRALGARDVLGIPLPTPAPVVRGYLVYRTDADFSSRDAARARQVQPLLSGLDSHFDLLCRWRALNRARTAEPRAGGGAGTAGGEDSGEGPGGRPDTAAARAAERAADLRLTPREITVLTLLGEALPAAAIGRRLGISVRTVHKHVESLYRKLGTNDRLATVLRAQREGLLPPGRR
ncbi:response regulator transcription factor [Streptomyces albus subsp. chlorinus]|nr:LuxR C-terminal-related transcriptional regulator [Streptomyces albus]NSC24665.1 response regulator transcription factor [Streptomyces albus subsp. chlorinus]